MPDATEATTIDQAARIAEIEAELAEALRKIAALHRVMQPTGESLTVVATMPYLNEYGDPASREQADGDPRA
jgi:hypothetical protein